LDKNKDKEAEVRRQQERLTGLVNLNQIIINEIDRSQQKREMERDEALFVNGKVNLPPHFLDVLIDRDRSLMNAKRHEEQLRQEKV
jgi:hypothetical protein